MAFTTPTWSSFAFFILRRNDLWQEYEAQLKPDEVLAMRPDLMLELGNKVQELDMAKF